jgi:hypothetical protein
MPITDVILTIDIEFTIAGAFAQPDRLRPVGPPSVLGLAGGQELGLGFILDTLRRHGATATFFVETLNTAHFGLQPMGEIALRIKEAGHDVQLHLHPCWLTFEDAEALRQARACAPSDACGSLSVEALVRVIQRGQQVFAAWGLPPPQALRTGGFSVSRQVYTAQKLTNIPLASNICAAVEPPADPALHLQNGRHLLEGVIEAPALSFVDRRWRGRPHLRPLQVTACSAAELQSALSAANEAGLDTLVAVTHAFEFFKRRTALDYAQIRPNWINQRRLEALCDHVNRHPTRFRWASFGQREAAWARAPNAAQREVRGSGAQALWRMAENGLNDRLWRL